MAEGQNRPEGQRIPARAALPYLRAWRVYRGMSQRQLSKDSGVSQNTLVYLEAGDHQAYATTIGKLARALRVKPYVLAFVNPDDIGEDIEKGRGAA